MGWFLLLFFAFVLTVFSWGILGMSLLLPLVLAFAFHFEVKQSYGFAFAVGLIGSLVDPAGTVWGRESLALLLAILTMHFYRQKFSGRNPVFIPSLCFLGSLIYSLVMQRLGLLFKGVVDVALTIGFLPLLFRFKDRFFSEELVLKV